MSRTIRIAVVCLLTANAAIAQEPDHTAHGALAIGSVHFRNSGNTAAQAPFQRGVAWLHNFKYPEAAQAFREAQAADSTLAVAYWLEALTYSHVLWRVENLPRARETLTRLGATPALRLAKARSPRERAFGAAVEAFFVEAPQSARTLAYSDSLERLAAADTTDLEVAAFAAHAALMAWSTGTAEQKPRLAAAARSHAMHVFNANPNHPGAAHYLTHLADVDASSAADLLPFARAYDKIAPDADHALHMPSHVYLPLGMWRETTSANERAWAASRAEVKRDKDTPANLSWHSLQWLQYAYLQEGRWAAARGIIDTARAALAGVQIPEDQADARFAVEVLTFTYCIETGDWSAWSAPASRMSESFGVPMPSQHAFVMAMTNAYDGALGAIFTNKDTASAREVAKRLRVIADTIPPEALPGALRRAAGQIEGLLERRDDTRAIEMLRAAGRGEVGNASYPPIRVPSQDLIGAALLKANRPVEAAAAYRASLGMRPNRSSALLGLMQALRASGDTTGAADARRRLADNWQRADPRVLRLLDPR
jgi:hypothetical protein